MNLNPSQIVAALAALGVYPRGPSTGAVNSVAVSTPTGLVVSGSPGAGDVNITIALEEGYVIPTQEELDSKISSSEASPIQSLEGPVESSDEFLAMRAGVPYKAPMTALPGGSSGGSPVTLTHDGAGANPVVGDTITANFAAGWSGSLQWLRDGTPIVDATGASYVVTEDDIGAVVAPAVSSLVYTAPGMTAAAVPVGGLEIVAMQLSTPAFGAEPVADVPAGAVAGDRLLVMFGVSQTVTNVGGGYADISPADATALDHHVYLSDPIVGTPPTTVPIVLGGNALVTVRVFVVRGTGNVIVDSGSLVGTGGISPDPRPHPYTTTGAGRLVFGLINFGDGGVTGVTGEDTEHSWSLLSGGGYEQVFYTPRAVADDYAATLGPTGAPSSSGGFWFALGAPGGAPAGALNLVGTPTSNGGYGDVQNIAIPAVGVGNSLVVLVASEREDTRIDGATRDTVSEPLLYSNFAHAFRIENITDERTSLTLRTLLADAPSAANASWIVFEVDAAGLVLASTPESTIEEFNGLALNQVFTTTVNNASGFMIASLSNAADAIDGGGWTGIGVGTYGPAGYSMDLGEAGEKTCGVTISAARNRAFMAVAYGRA